MTGTESEVRCGEVERELSGRGTRCGGGEAGGTWALGGLGGLKRLGVGQ